MGHFFLMKKKGNDAVNSNNTKIGISIFKIGFSSQRTDPQNAFIMPSLKIDTRLANNLTPPPTPVESPQSGKGNPFGLPKWSSSQNTSFKSRISSRLSSASTPPHSPKSKSPTIPSQRKKSFTPLSLLKTPRQRKLQEIREGKLPAIQSDPEDNRNSTSSTSSDVDSIPTEMCDPSSSTTYSPRNRQRKRFPKETTSRKASPISTAITTMQVSF